MDDLFFKLKRLQRNSAIGVVMLLSLIIGLIVTDKWFNNNTILYYWDSLFSFSPEISTKFLYSWGSNFFPGTHGFGWSWLLYVFSVSGLQALLGSLSLAQKTLYVSFIILSIISFYLLLDHVLSYLYKNNNRGNLFKVSTFIFSVIYALNLYTFYYSYFMFNPQIFIYSILPLHILSLIKLYPLDKIGEKSKYRSLWIFIFFGSLIYMIPGFTSYIFLAQYLLILAFYFSFYIFVSEIKLLSKKFLEIVLFYLLIILTQWWWFTPTLLGFRAQFTSQGSLGTDIYIELGSINSNLLNVLRFLGSPMMNNNPFSWDGWYTNNIIFTIPLFLFPLLLIFLMLKIRMIKHKNLILFLLAVFLTTLFIIKSGNPPFAWAYKFSFKYIPFFGAFRDAYQKAGLYFIFSYLALITIGFTLFINYLYQKGKKYLIYITFMILITAGIVATAPFLLFSFDNIKKINFSSNDTKYTLNGKTQIPPEYYQLKKSLEGSCNRTVILVIPRTSLISNAVWPKYNNSYVGQDMLSRLIDCNFITTTLIQNDSDSFTTAPYLFLQQGDYEGFKNYLIQNQIGKILIRKDYIPYYFTNSVYVDPKKTMELVNNDNDFNKTFENEFFVVYDLIKLGEYNNYGFALTSNVAFTNSSLNYGKDYKVLSKGLGEKRKGVVINDGKNLEKFKQEIKTYVAIADCIGCIEIDRSINLNIQQEGKLTKFKKFIKYLLVKTNDTHIPQQDQISNSILESNDNFIKLVNQIRNKNDETSKSLISTYIFSLINSINKINYLEGNFFDKNNKMLEISSYLKAQKNALAELYESDKSGEYLKSNQYHGEFAYLLSLQNSILFDLTQKIIKTESENSIYRMRLDISKKGDYKCSTNISSSISSIENIVVNNAKNNISIKPKSDTYVLTEGNYLINVKYLANSIIAEKSINTQERGITELSLGKLTNGKYKIKFEKENISNKETVMVAIARKKMNPNAIRIINNPRENFIFFEIASKHLKEGKYYESYFNIDTTTDGVYYLYVLTPDSLSNDSHVLNLVNLSIGSVIQDKDIYFYCSLNTKQDIDSSTKIRVTKINPTLYKIELPKNYKNNFLTFNQAYADDWEASTMINGKKHIYYHIKNTYANGWYIDQLNDNHITIQYKQQNLAIINAIVSLTLFILLFIVYIKIFNR